MREMVSKLRANNRIAEMRMMDVLVVQNLRFKECPRCDAIIAQVQGVSNVRSCAESYPQVTLATERLSLSVEDPVSAVIRLLTAFSSEEYCLWITC